MKLLWLMILIFIFPASASAAVYFSEIAWMGSVESVNHEWIELYNDGGAVSVDGWQIVDGNNLTIDLIGNIPANAHVVLERSSDDTVAGTAFLIYTGSLVNTGATLRLLRGDGSLVDQISGGSDWQNIGGNNETKETAQYTSSGWTTSIATPGSSYSGKSSQSNNDEEKEEHDDNNSSNSTNQTVTRSSSGSGESVELKLPGVTLKLAINAPVSGYVNQPIKFQSTASGIGDSLIDSLQYEWNFGNGEVSAEENPKHIFKYPGKYVVTLYASFKRQEQIARHEITILPISLSLSINKQGDIVINNESKYEVDLSNYRLKGRETFILPARTILLPNQSIIIDDAKVGSVAKSLVAIYDAEGVVVDMLTSANILVKKVATNPPVVDRSPAPMISAISTNKQFASNGNNQQFGFVSSEPIQKKDTTITLKNEAVTEEEETVSPDQLANVSQSDSPVKQNWPYFALIGLILLAIFGALLTNKSNQSN